MMNCLVFDGGYSVYGWLWLVKKKSTGWDDFWSDRWIDSALALRLLRIFCAAGGSEPRENGWRAGQVRQQKCAWHNLGVSQNGWFIMENTVKVGDLGVPPFQETHILALFHGLKRPDFWSLNSAHWCTSPRLEALQTKLIDQAQKA